MRDADVASTIELVKVRWAATGLTLRPGVSTRDVEAFERAHGVRLPADFVEYLHAVDGMDHGAADGRHFSFWPLARMTPAGRELPNSPGLEGCFVFADWLIWSHAYALRFRDGAADVVLIGGKTPVPVAASFAEFLSAYLKDDRSIYG